MLSQDVLPSFITLLITIVTLVQFYVQLKKETQKHNNILLETLQEIIINLETTNRMLINKIDKLIMITKQGKEEIIVENQKQMNVIRSGLNLRQKLDWLTEMVDIFYENELDKKEFALEKIETKTNNVLFKTDLDYRSIKGTNDYLIGYNNIILFLKKNDIYLKIYEIMIDYRNKNKICKYTNTYCQYSLRRELGNLWDIVQTQLFKEYSETIDTNMTGGYNE